MNITADEFKILENEVFNKVLYFSLSDEYSNEVDRAKNIFRTILERNSYSYNEKNFTSWLLWDYKLENKNNFFQEYKRINGSKLIEKQYNMLESIMNSYLSIYEIVPYKKNKKLIDIFSKKKFDIEQGIEKIGSKDLLIARIVDFQGQNYVLDEYLTLDKAFQSAIEKSFYEKFQNYKEKNGVFNMEQFIIESSLLLYSFADIVDDLVRKQIEDNNQYSVYQSNYAVLDYDNLYEALSKSMIIELDYKHSGAFFYIMYEKGKKRVLSEIVLFKEKLEIECTSEGDNNRAKQIIEDIANDSIKYMSDEFITMDDII